MLLEVRLEAIHPPLILSTFSKRGSKPSENPGGSRVRSPHPHRTSLPRLPLVRFSSMPPIPTFSLADGCCSATPIGREFGRAPSHEQPSTRLRCSHSSCCAIERARSMAHVDGEACRGLAATKGSERVKVRAQTRT